MTSNLEDDDEIFYGGGKAVTGKKEENDKAVKESTSYSHDAEKNASYSHDYLKPTDETDSSNEPSIDKPAVTPREEKDIEAEIAHTRQDKMRAAEYHDVTILRQRAAKHSAEAAKLFKKYRSEEAAMVKYQEHSNKARRKAEKYVEKSKDALAKADDKQADLEYLEGGKAERARVKIAKFKEKAARMKSKSSRWQANSAKNTQKAAAKRQKAKALLEQSKVHEAEALNYNKRADRLSKA